MFLGDVPSACDVVAVASPLTVWTSSAASAAVVVAAASFCAVAAASLLGAVDAAAGALALAAPCTGCWCSKMEKSSSFS